MLDGKIESSTVSPDLAAGSASVTAKKSIKENKVRLGQGNG
jgi:hypothetical protein